MKLYDNIERELLAMSRAGHDDIMLYCPYRDAETVRCALTHHPKSGYTGAVLVIESREYDVYLRRTGSFCWTRYTYDGSRTVEPTETPDLMIDVADEVAT